MCSVEQIDSGKMGSWSVNERRRATAALMRENEKQEEVRREGHVTATGELGINAGHQAGELQNLSQNRIMGFPAYK